jgi:competence protein ComFC
VGSLCETELCFDCRTTSLSLKNRSSLSYKGLAKDLFQSLKFRGYKRLLDYFIGEPPEFPKDAVLVPLPPNPKRIRKGGYDMVKDLTKAWSLGRETISLFGRRESREQKELNRKDRGTRIQLYLKASPPKDKTIILVDDILTTGASLAQAYELLLSRGCRSVQSRTLFCRSY